mgnify:CR=1 FL=1
MKHLVKFFVVTFILVVSTSAFAEQKIVVMDMTYVLNNSKAGKEAQEFLKNKFNDNAKKFADIEKELRQGENDLLAKKTILSKEEYTSKSDELRKQVIDYQSKRRSSLDKIAKQRAEARETLVNKVKPLVDDYIKENGISLVIDKKNMVGGRTEYDITTIIVEKLNKELPSLNLK